jgi:acetolactate synthase-1/2/3 large subunit
MFKPDGSPLGVRQRGIQEVDIVSIVQPLTKYAVTVTDPSSIRYHLEKAVHLARTGRPGPVWIDIPIDVQAATVDETRLRRFDPVEIPPRIDSHLGKEVSGVIERLNRAERPLLLIGNGIRLSGAEGEVLDLVCALDIPVAATWVAMDLIGDDHPRFVGKPGTVAARGANFAVQNCDFLLSIGARLDLPVIGWSAAQFARGAHKVMVDVDPGELAKLAEFMDASICADAGAFMREILRQRAAIKPRDRGAWLAKCADWKARYPIVQAEHRVPEGRVSIYHLAEIIGEEAAPEDQVVSGSSGSGIEIFLFAYRARRGQRVIHTAGLGAMGFGIPASIGVCVGSGRKRTVCVDGDGGFQLNIQELATIAHLQLPIKFFILNNDGYASIRASQANFFGEPSIGCSEATGVCLPDFKKVAHAYGLSSAVIEDQRDLREQVRRVLRMPGPVVCDVKVIPDEVRAPRVTSVQRPDGSFVSRPLEDLWPFLDRDEFEENMLVELVRE